MKKRSGFLYLLLAALVAGGTGCAVADTGAFERLQDQMVSLKREMARLKAAPPPAAAPAAQTGGGDVQGLRKNFADLSNDVDRMKTDLLAVSTRVDDAKAERQRMAARLDEQERAIQEMRGNAGRMKEVEKRVAALEEKVGKLSGSSAPAAAAEAPKEWKSPEEMYEFAVGQIKGGNPKKGREILSSFVTRYPGHKLLPNALYWKGEAFYAEKDYENAILAFQDVVDKYPGGDKAPDAMYKQGLSFLALKDRKNAKILLDLVSTKYPRTNAADLAKKKLAEIR